jgi:hypothetical protein
MADVDVCATCLREAWDCNCSRTGNSGKYVTTSARTAEILFEIRNDDDAEVRKRELEEASKRWGGK